MVRKQPDRHDQNTHKSDTKSRALELDSISRPELPQTPATPKEQGPESPSPRRAKRPRKLKINPIHNDKKQITDIRNQGSENKTTRGQITAQLNHPTRPRRSLTGGGDRNRTDDLLLAKQALSQLSYTPESQGSGIRYQA